MHKHPLFISWVLLLTCIAALHIIALEFFLYWVYPWFDIMMHFLGGVFVGLSMLWFFFESGYVSLERCIRNVILISVTSIVFVGVSWEVFEVLAGMPIEDNFVLDTAIDLIMDMLGAFIAGVIFIKMFLVKDEVVKKQTEYGDPVRTDPEDSTSTDESTFDGTGENK